MLGGFADVHVVPAIVQEALPRRGMDVATARQRGLQEADDNVSLAAAVAEERVMLTNADFLMFAAHCSANNKTVAPIYFWPQQGRPIGEMVRHILREASLEDYPSAHLKVHSL